MSDPNEPFGAKFGATYSDTGTVDSYAIARADGYRAGLRRAAEICGVEMIAMSEEQAPTATAEMPAGLNHNIKNAQHFAALGCVIGAKRCKEAIEREAEQ